MLCKEELREYYKYKRSILSDETVKCLSEKIAKNIALMNIFHLDFFHIFLTMTQQKEVDTQFIIDLLWEQNKTIITSKTSFKERELKHFILRKDTSIMVNKWGIPEPNNAQEVKPYLAQVVFVPLLAYDIWGGRVGYGKGFYDRFLQQCHSNTLKIGLSFFSAQTEKIPNSTFDVPLDIVVTPNDIFYMIK